MSRNFHHKKSIVSVHRRQQRKDVKAQVAYIRATVAKRRAELAAAAAEPVEPSLEELTVPELKHRARHAEIPGYSSMRKAELVAALKNARYS